MQCSLSYGNAREEGDMSQATATAYHQANKGRGVKSRHVRLGTKYSQGKKWFEILFLPVHSSSLAEELATANHFKQRSYLKTCSYSSGGRTRRQNQSSNKNCRVGILKEATQRRSQPTSKKHHRPPASSSVCIKKGCPSRHRRAQAVCGEGRMLPLQSLSAGKGNIAIFFLWEKVTSKKVVRKNEKI
jgi:hypothetical protein